MFIIFVINEIFVNKFEAINCVRALFVLLGLEILMASEKPEDVLGRS